MYKSYTKDVNKQLDFAIELALDEIGYYVEGMAVLYSPVDTGKLRDSITHEVEEDKVTIGTNVEYSVYVEKGTIKQAPQPYLTPAVEDNISAIRTMAGKVVQQNMAGKTRTTFKGGSSK